MLLLLTRSFVRIPIATRTLLNLRNAFNRFQYNELDDLYLYNKSQHDLFSNIDLLTVNEEDRALFHVSGDKYEEKLAVMMQETLQLATGESVFPVEMQNRKYVHI